jgi:putative transposase
MKKEMSNSTPNSVYDINYYLVRSTKYRKPVLISPVDAGLKDLLAPTAAERGYDALGFRGDAGSCSHLSLRAASGHPSVIANVLKVISARRLFTMFPHLKRRL